MSFVLENGTIDNAIQTCLDAGIIVVCASGNDSSISTFLHSYELTVNAWDNSSDLRFLDLT